MRRAGLVVKGGAKVDHGGGGKVDHPAGGAASRREASGRRGGYARSPRPPPRRPKSKTQSTGWRRPSRPATARSSMRPAARMSSVPASKSCARSPTVGRRRPERRLTASRYGTRPGSSAPRRPSRRTPGASTAPPSSANAPALRVTGLARGGSRGAYGPSRQVRTALEDRQTFALVPRRTRPRRSAAHRAELCPESGHAYSRLSERISPRLSVVVRCASGPFLDRVWGRVRGRRNT